MARSEGRSRSELVREALRQYLARRERRDRIFSYAREAARQTGATEQGVARVVKERRRGRARQVRALVDASVFLCRCGGRGQG